MPILKARDLDSVLDTVRIFLDHERVGYVGWGSGIVNKAIIRNKDLSYMNENEETRIYHLLYTISDKNLRKHFENSSTFVAGKVSLVENFAPFHQHWISIYAYDITTLKAMSDGIFLPMESNAVKEYELVAEICKNGHRLPNGVWNRFIKSLAEHQ
jgi:hypothetical protein